MYLCSKDAYFVQENVDKIHSAQDFRSNVFTNIYIQCHIIQEKHFDE